MADVTLVASVRSSAPSRGIAMSELVTSRMPALATASHWPSGDQTTPD